MDRRDNVDPPADWYIVPRCHHEAGTCAVCEPVVSVPANVVLGAE